VQVLLNDTYEQQKRAFPISDPKTIFLQAEAFKNSAIFINNKAFKYSYYNHPLDRKLYITQKVNEAFAFELYLKYLMGIETGKFVDGHDLLKLFQELNQQTQDKIIANHEKGIIYGPAHTLLHGIDAKDNFLDILSNTGKAFVELRYMFDDAKYLNYDFGFTINFVRWMILKLRPDYEIQDL